MMASERANKREGGREREGGESSHEVSTPVLSAPRLEAQLKKEERERERESMVRTDPE